MTDDKLNELITNVFNSMTDEQKKKAKECKTVGELMKFAGTEGIELPDEMADMISAGIVPYGESNARVLPV